MLWANSMLYVAGYTREQRRHDRSSWSCQYEVECLSWQSIMCAYAPFHNANFFWTSSLDRHLFLTSLVHNFRNWTRLLRISQKILGRLVFLSRLMQESCKEHTSKLQTWHDFAVSCNTVYVVVSIWQMFTWRCGYLDVGVWNLIRFIFHVPYHLKCNRQFCFGIVRSI